MNPCPVSLLEPIKRLVELSHLVGTTLNKALRLSHEDFFSQITTQEGIIDIKLLEKPSLRKSNRENKSNCDKFYHWAEGFIQVKSRFLQESLGYNLALCLLTKPSGFSLTLKIPLQPMTFFPLGNSTSVHVLLLRRAVYSSFMAACQTRLKRG